MNTLTQVPFRIDRLPVAVRFTSLAQFFYKMHVSILLANTGAPILTCQ